MSVWATKSVTEQPSLTLVRWRIIETERNERHFVGYSPDNREGRVSSAIQTFDPQTLRGVTRSGRVYELVGQPGFDSDADYVLGIWLQINHVTTMHDVTDAVIPVNQATPVNQ